jgi:hypothetical protein
MIKKNCWDIMKCGRNGNGNKTHELGVCPIAVEKLANGLCGGINGGRLCWIIADTKYRNKLQCFKNHKKASCGSCDFRNKVIEEEGLLSLSKAIDILLHQSSH